MEDYVNIINFGLAHRDAFLGAIGGGVVYLYDYTKATRTGDKEFVFRFSSLIINVILGLFVAYGVGTVIDASNPYRDIILLSSGFSAYNILTLTESRFAEYLFNKFTGGKK